MCESKSAYNSKQNWVPKAGKRKKWLLVKKGEKAKKEMGGREREMLWGERIVVRLNIWTECVTELTTHKFLEVQRILCIKSSDAD